MYFGQYLMILFLIVNCHLFFFHNSFFFAFRVWRSTSMMSAKLPFQRFRRINVFPNFLIFLETSWCYSKRNQSIWRAVYRLTNVATSLFRLKHKKSATNSQPIKTNCPSAGVFPCFFPGVLIGSCRSLRRLRNAKIISSLLTKTLLHDLRLSAFFVMSFMLYYMHQAF